MKNKNQNKLFGVKDLLPDCRIKCRYDKIPTKINQKPPPFSTLHNLCVCFYTSCVRVLSRVGNVSLRTCRQQLQLW